MCLQIYKVASLRETLNEYSEKDFPTVSRIIVDDIINNQMYHHLDLLNEISKNFKNIINICFNVLLESANPINDQLVNSFMLLLKRDAQMKVKVHPKITECKGITFNKKTQYDQQDYIDCFNLFYAVEK